MNSAENDPYRQEAYILLGETGLRGRLEVPKPFPGSGNHGS